MFLCAQSVLGQQPSLRETVVVTAHSSPVAFEDLGRSVVVIDREQIRSLPVQSVADLLRYVASVDVQRRSPFGVQTDFSARGAGFGQTLILVDGIRINDSQTGHHNGDIPVTLSQVERIEVLHGAGSSVFGADAFGAAINIVTREGGGSEARFSAGEHGLFEGDLYTSIDSKNLTQAISFSGSRSSGFMFDRDFRTFAVSSQTDLKPGGRIFASHLRKEFGANGFYGPSPSREWTDATLISFQKEVAETGRTRVDTQFFYRSHGDRFLWDVRRPGQFENHHRTHAAGASVKSRHRLDEDTALTWGFELGHDWIDSNNLGDHSFGRWAIFTELQKKIGDRWSLVPGLRFDRYDDFGSALNPALSTSWWINSRFKLRASAGQAFRIPTFTELFYADPNHRASSELSPEEATEVEGGFDWMLSQSWLLQASAFSRWDRNVIDWVRASPEQQWQTTNIRELQTEGVELNLQKNLEGNLSVVQGQYTYLNSATDSLELLSKYTLDFARHTASGFVTLRLPGRIELGQDLSYKLRSDGRSYWLVNQKWIRSVGACDLFLEISNLLDTEYQEVRNVRMPGRWIRGGIEFRGLPWVVK